MVRCHQRNKQGPPWLLRACVPQVLVFALKVSPAVPKDSIVGLGRRSRGMIPCLCRPQTPAALASAGNQILLSWTPLDCMDNVGWRSRVFTGSGSWHSLLSSAPDRFLADWGFFLPSSVCWDPHAECSAGIFGCTQPWGCAYKRLLKPSGKKKYLFVELVCSVFRQVMDPSPASPSPKVLPIRNKRGHRRTQSTLHVCMKMSNPWGETNTGIEKINSYWVEWDLLEYSSNSSSLTPAHKPLFASSFLCWKCYILLRTAHFTRREV